MGEPGPDRLAQTYHAALYRIDTPTPILLKIGAAQPELKALARTLQRPSWGVFLSASNPRSRLLRPAANGRRLKALQRALRQAGYSWVPGRGLDPAGRWPDEPSLWIPGLPESVAHALARQFGQNAFVWCDEQTVAHLVWTAPIR